jgi:uncharacterized membrane protein (DUF485 family)
MKKLKEQRTRKLLFLSVMILAMVACMSFLTAPKTTLGVTTAMALVVGGVTLEGKEEAMYKALSDVIEKQKEKYDKEYISEKKMLDSIAEAIKASKINFADDEEFKKLNSIIEKQGLEIVALKDVGSKQPIFKSFEDQIKDQIKEKSLIDAAKTAPGQKLKLELKAANVPITTANAVNPASSYIPMPTMDSAWDRAPRLARFLRMFASVATTSSPLHVWAEKYNEQGDAEFISEGELKPMISFQIRTRDSKAKKIAVGAKFTTETLQDIPNFVAELKSEILEVVDIKEEAGLLNGDGIGDNLLGVIQQATTYVLTTIFTKGANNFDAMKAAITQLFTLSQIPNVVFVNPIDKANMELTKASDGHYILPPFSTADGTIISGVRVVESNSVAVGKFLLGDWTKLNIRDYIAFEITLGWENDDFTKNLVTVLGEKRLMSYIKEHQKTAFLYGDFATIKAAIEEEVGG